MMMNQSSPILLEPMLWLFKNLKVYFLQADDHNSPQIESTIQGLTTFLDENHEYLLQKLKESDKALDGRTSLSLEVLLTRNFPCNNCIVCL